MSLTKDQIFYGDVQVRNNAQGFISLNDMWVAAGCPESKHIPHLWKDESGKEFIEHIAKSLNVRLADIYKTTRGKFGGTWAHWQIALAYAKYLSPEFHAWANQAIKDRIEEDHSPELGITKSRDRAIENWRKKGKDDDYIAARIKSIDARNDFTGTLKTTTYQEQDTEFVPTIFISLFWAVALVTLKNKKDCHKSPIYATTCHLLN